MISGELPWSETLALSYTVNGVPELKLAMRVELPACEEGLRQLSRTRGGTGVHSCR